MALSVSLLACLYDHGHSGEKLARPALALSRSLGNCLWSSATHLHCKRQARGSSSEEDKGPECAATCSCPLLCAATSFLVLPCARLCSYMMLRPALRCYAVLRAQMVNVAEHQLDRRCIPQYTTMTMALS